MCHGVEFGPSRQRCQGLDVRLDRWTRLHTLQKASGKDGLLTFLTGSADCSTGRASPAVPCQAPYGIDFLLSAAILFLDSPQCHGGSCTQASVTSTSSMFAPEEGA